MENKIIDPERYNSAFLACWWNENLAQCELLFLLLEGIDSFVTRAAECIAENSHLEVETIEDFFKNAIAGTNESALPHDAMTQKLRDDPWGILAQVAIHDFHGVLKGLGDIPPALTEEDTARVGHLLELLFGPPDRRRSTPLGTVAINVRIHDEIGRIHIPINQKLLTALAPHGDENTSMQERLTIWLERRS